MISNMAQADKEMADLFRKKWETENSLICDWPNRKVAEHGQDDTWARWSLDYAFSEQSSFGPKGHRKVYKEGIIYINVFTPLGAGLSNARKFAQIAVDAYELQRTPNDVWFRSVQIASEGRGRGSGRDKSWWTTLVTARFQYEYLR